MILNLFLICTISVLSSSSENVPSDPYDQIIDDLSHINQKWLQMNLIPEIVHLSKLPPLSYALKSDYSSVNITNALESIKISEKDKLVSENIEKCSGDLVQILENLSSRWAIEMLDSDGKLSSSVLSGSLTWPGNYRECKNVKSPMLNNGDGGFHGRYCMLTWTLKLPGKLPKLSLNTGLCIPDSCDANEIMTAAKNIALILERLPLIKKFVPYLTLESLSCKFNSPQLDAATIVYLFLLFVFLLMVTIGSSITGYNYYFKNQNNSVSEDEPNQENISESDSVKVKSVETESCEVSINEGKSILPNNKTSRGFLNVLLQDIFLCFCAFTNGSKIFNTNVSGNQLLSINGIRFLSLTWVIMGHTYISSVNIIGNPLEVLGDIDNLPFQMLLQAPFSVDSFFLLSGFLLTYLFLKEADRTDGKINWVYFYLHRVWRLTPVYMLVVGFYMLVFKYLGSGPFWDENYGDSCRSTWWWYLLYISNFIPVKDMCVGWSWYMANDMQFYLVSPLFLYILWRWPKVGITVIISLLVGSWTITGILSYQYDLIPMFVGVTKATDFHSYQDRMWYSFDMIYDKPYCRIPPYLIGALLGYCIHRIGNRKNFLNWWQQVVGWIVAIFCSASVVFGLFHADLSKETALFYNAMCRSSFSVGLAWVIFACETGHGGVISKFLSLKYWIPLSRLTFCAYLVHPVLIHGYFQSMQTVLYFTQMVMVTNFMGFLLIAYFLAFVVSFTFESPMLNLEKLLLKRSKRQ